MRSGLGQYVILSLYISTPYPESTCTHRTPRCTHRTCTHRTQRTDDGGHRTRRELCGSGVAATLFQFSISVWWQRAGSREVRAARSCRGVITYGRPICSRQLLNLRVELSIMPSWTLTAERSNHRRRGICFSEGTAAGSCNRKRGEKRTNSAHIQKLRFVI